MLAAVADDSRELIYRDDSMAQVVKLAQQIAGSDASVLITGESGTGKEVLARYVPPAQPRQEAVHPVNCAAIPETLLESELFGHEKGAFTGAVRAPRRQVRGGQRRHALARRDFRDGSAAKQKLLRAIQERMIDRVGGTRPVPIDIRIIATSNRNLAEAVRENTFREDLLFRLNVVNLKLPPLRERPADVIELAEYFIKKYSIANGVPARPLAQEARRTLTINYWPGNVRELEHTMHRAVLIAMATRSAPRRSWRPTAPASISSAARRASRTPRSPPSKSRARSSAAPSPRSSAT